MLALRSILIWKIAIPRFVLATKNSSSVLPPRRNQCSIVFPALIGVGRSCSAPHHLILLLAGRRLPTPIYERAKSRPIPSPSRLLCAYRLKQRSMQTRSAAFRRCATTSSRFTCRMKVPARHYSSKLNLSHFSLSLSLFLSLFLFSSRFSRE
jgi:hypothetical protein